jgi:hypothetical protein
VCNSQPMDNIQGLEGYSPQELLYEYYNLIGTKETAQITPYNNHIKNFFELEADCGNYSKLNFTKPSEDFIQKKKNTLANYYLSDESLSLSQKNFLFWHFTSPKNYSNSTITFTHKEPDYVVGWNSNITTNNFHIIYTFGLIGCTCVICYSDDGNISVSHFDSMVNPLQKQVVSDFQKDHNINEIYIIGGTGKRFADSITEPIDYDIFLHEKKTGVNTTYSVMVSKIFNDNRDFSPIQISYASLPISADYIPSTHHGDYGKYFTEGNVSEIFPPSDNQFQLLEYNKI